MTDQNAPEIEQVDSTDAITVNDDPMLNGLEDMKAEIEAKNNPAPEPKAEDAVKDSPEPKTDDVDTAKGPIMVPKARLDEVLAKAGRLEHELTKTQAVLEVQSRMMYANKGTDEATQTEAKPGATVPADPESLIKASEDRKIEAAQKYEDGEISLVEWEKIRVEEDGKIRGFTMQEIKAAKEEAQNTAKTTAIELSTENQVIEEAVKIQEQYPYVAEIDALPPAIRDGIWAQITQEAKKSLSEKGVNPDDGSAASRVALIREKAELTKTYGPQYTGKKLDSQTAAGPSETALQRAAKADLSQQQPPNYANASTGGDVRELTEADIDRMSQDELADLAAKNPAVLARITGVKM